MVVPRERTRDQPGVDPVLGKSTLGRVRTEQGHATNWAHLNRETHSHAVAAGGSSDNERIKGGEVVIGKLAVMQRQIRCLKRLPVGITRTEEDMQSIWHKQNCPKRQKLLTRVTHRQAVAAGGISDHRRVKRGDPVIVKVVVR
jgi:hypothetical protein